MQKTYCDKCGKEINQVENKELSAQVKGGFKEYDLCDKCSKKIIEFIEK